MIEFGTDAASFAKAVAALDPYLGDIVFIGGWAHQLFTLHPTASTVAFEPLRTQDADIAAPLGLQPREESIAARLKAAGFVQEFKGSDTPPVTEYRLGEEEGGFYIEFLAPLIGGDLDRWGNRNVTVRVGGVTAQTLRYLEILLLDPWEIVLSESNGFPLGPNGKRIHIASPAAYVVQKILVYKGRAPSKQGKDVLYIHDTFHVFAEAVPTLRESWRKISAQMHPAHVSKFLETANGLFNGVPDGARSAALIAASAGRVPAPTTEEIAAACRAGFKRVFDG